MRFSIQNNRRFFLLLAVMVLSFTLISFNISRSTDLSRLNTVDRIIFWMVSPFQQSIAAIKGTSKLVWYNYVYLVKLKEKNDVMRDRMERLETELSYLREKVVATDRLASLLKFKESNPYDVIVARIIGVDSSGYFRTVTLDKGERDGVDINMTVATAKGIVGRVIKAHGAYSQVLLLVDYNSAIDAVVQRTRDKGIVIGQGGAVCEMKYVDSQSGVRTGDKIVSSGVTGIFPAGLVIGEVIQVEKRGGGLFKDVKVKPAVQVEKLEEVLIILKEKR